MRYRKLETKEIGYNFLYTLSEEDRKFMSVIFDISKVQYLYIEKIQWKSNNFVFYCLRDREKNYLVTDNRKNCLRFSNTKNVDRWIDLNDLIVFKLF